MDERSGKVLSSLQRLCSRQECCSRDVYAKALRKLDGDALSAQEVLESLEADDFVNDLRYCEAFCREKASLTGWGPVKISFALRGKGIDGETIALALESIDEQSAADRLLKVLHAKQRTLEGDPQARLKLIKYGLSRGYDYQQVEMALERIHKNTCHEEI